MGWIGAIVVGGLAGWIASQVMKSNTGILVNIVLGIVGAAVASWLFGFLGVAFSGILGYLIAGFLGGSILIYGSVSRSSDPAPPPSQPRRSAARKSLGRKAPSSAPDSP